MENTGTVCTQMADCSLPRSNNHGRCQPLENVLLGRLGEAMAIKDNVEKVRIWPMRAPLSIKLQQKRTKGKSVKLYSYKLLTSLLQPYLFYFT